MKKILGRIAIVLPAVALQIAWYVLLVVLLDRGLGGHLGEVLISVFTLLAFFFVIFLIIASSLNHAIKSV